MKTLLIGGARSGKSALAQRWATERSNSICTIVTASDSDPEMSARIAAHRRDRPADWRVREELIHLGRALRDESTNGSLILLDCLTLWISNCLWPQPTAIDQPASTRLTTSEISTAADPTVPATSATATAADPTILATSATATAADPTLPATPTSASAPVPALRAKLTIPTAPDLALPATPTIATADDASIPNTPLWRHERTDFLDALQASTADVIIVTNEVGTGIVPNNASSRVFRDEQGWLNQSVAALCDEVFFVTAGLSLRLKPT